MSKRIKEISDDFNKKKTSAKSALDSNKKLGIKSFAAVQEVPKGHYDEEGNWQTDSPKYQYCSWGERNTRAEANSDRNSDIDSKIAILDSRINSCESRYGELKTIISDCKKSIENLKKDLDILTSAKTSFDIIKSNTSKISVDYSKAHNSVNYTYKCFPKKLDEGTMNGINDTKKSFSNKAISDGITKIINLQQEGEQIKTEAESLEEQLNARIEELNAQKFDYNGMKK